MSLKPEEIAHINIVNWFRHNYPDLIEDFHHFANERKCSYLEGRKLKKMGVQKGVADFFLALPLPLKGKGGLWIELKVGNGKMSLEQKKFLARKVRRGYEALCVIGEEAAQAAIKTYLEDL